MKANELRLGNYVYAVDRCNKDSGLSIARITSISENLIQAMIIENKFSSNEIAIIKLTSEILEKCGFEKNQEGWSDKNMDLYFSSSLYFGEGSRLYLSGDSYHAFSQEIKYLHQLQNIYFAITGEELEMKL